MPAARRNSASAAPQKNIACQRVRWTCVVSPVVVLFISVLLDITLITPTIAFISCRSLDVDGYPQVRPYPAKYRVGATVSRLNMSGPTINRGPAHLLRPTINRGPTHFLSAHEERWTGIGGRKLHVARLTIAKGQWLRVRGCLSRMPTFGAAIGTACGQRVASVLAVAMAVA